MNVSTLIPPTDDTYQNYQFDEFMETGFINYLIENYITQQQDVPGNIGATYAGDFYGLLSYLKIPINLHYILMRVNGFYNGGDYDGSPIVVLVPKEDECMSLKNVFKTITPSATAST